MVQLQFGQNSAIYSIVCISDQIGIQKEGKN